MGKPITPILAIAFAAVAGSAAAQAPARTLQVVELFTSQGCSTCPPANAAVAALSARPDILALSFGVTYWDQLGWKDTFASKAYTDRQWDYARGLRHSNVGTPQVVINGRTDVVGQRVSDIEGALRRAPLAAGGPVVSLEGGVVSVTGAALLRPADVWLVRYDPRVVQVPIQRGENGGKTLPHKNVVRELTKLGEWTGGARTWRAPPGPADLRTAVVLQAPSGGPILAAARS
jgi:hypothetical protein